MKWSVPVDYPISEVQCLLVAVEAGQGVIYFDSQNMQCRTRACSLLLLYQSNVIFEEVCPSASSL